MKKLLMALLPFTVFAETVRLDIEVKDYEGNPLPGYHPMRIQETSADALGAVGI